MGNRIITCDDGTVIRGDSDEELVARLLAHLRSAHPELVGRISAEEILAMIHPEWSGSSVSSRKLISTSTRLRDVPPGNTGHVTDVSPPRFPQSRGGFETSAAWADPILTVGLQEEA